MDARCLGRNEFSLIYLVDKYAGFYNDSDSKLLFLFSFWCVKENNAKTKDMRKRNGEACSSRFVYRMDKSRWYFVRREESSNAEVNDV